MKHLLDVVSIKLLCWKANVASVDAGPKGALIGFRDKKSPTRPRLSDGSPVRGTLAKLRPDMKLVVMRSWDSPEERLKGARQLMAQLVKLAA